MGESRLRIASQGWNSAQRLAAEDRLFAVLDACDAPAVPEKAKEIGAERAMSLYRGRLAEQHWEIGPYLFRIDGALLAWIAGTLKEEPWGIFAVTDTTNQDFDLLFEHFQKFVLVRVADENVYFRFYDPRVLPHFLQTAPAEELSEFFGPCRFVGGMNSRADHKETEELSWFWLE